MNKEKYIIDELKKRLMDEEVEKQLEQILEIDLSFIKGANSRLVMVRDLVEKKDKLNEVIAVLGNDYREIFKLILITNDLDNRLEKIKENK
ncbi:MAG: hypothetical protein ACRCX8_06695 [Sarcina sp.]